LAVTRDPDLVVADILRAVRETIAPLSHLTDTELEAQTRKLGAPMVRLQLRLRRLLREFSQ